MFMKRKQNPQFARRAFTLAEILTVVVILGIASAVVIPQVGNRDDLRVASASRVVIADLMYAQNLSIAKQVQHYVRFNKTTTPQTLAVFDSPALSTPINHPINKSAYLRNFAQNGALDIAEVRLDSVTIKAGNTTGVSLGFTSLGEPLLLDSTGTPLEIDDQAKITLIAGTYKQTIVIQPLTGEISVTTP